MLNKSGELIYLTQVFKYPEISLKGPRVCLKMVIRVNPHNP